MGIQITGLASGLDWQNIISELMTADRAPETQWKAQQTADNTQISSLATLGSDLSAFQTAADAISTNDTFTSTTASLSGTGWTATSGTNTNLGSYAFNVSQLATTSVLSGAENTGAAISATSDVSGVTVGTMNLATQITAGTFTVNGAQVNVTTGESLQDVFDAISTATGTAVSASYDPSSDKITLASSSPITLGAQNDTSNFLSATELFNNGTGTISSDQALGSVSLNSTIADSGLKGAITDVDSSGKGTFSINGVAFNFNVNTYSMQNILNEINASSAGVTATFNNSSGKFTLTNNSTGSTGITVSEAAGGLTAAMGLTGTGSAMSLGLNAKYTINGSNTFTSASNNLSAAAAGISGLSVDATSTGTQTVTVATDTSGISTAINSLIDAYNTVQTYITSQTQTTNVNGVVSTSTLSGNQDVLNMQAELQNMMFNAVSSATGGITALDQIGIGFTGTSPLLSITNQAALTQAISTNPTGVAQLFTNVPGGLVNQIDNYVTKAASSSGTIATQTKGLNSDVTNLTGQINNLETQIAAEQAQLTTEFTNMEAAEAKYQSEESTLESILNGGSSSSSSSSSSNNSSATQQNAAANASTSTATTG